MVRCNPGQVQTALWPCLALLDGETLVSAALEKILLMDKNPCCCTGP